MTAASLTSGTTTLRLTGPTLRERFSARVSARSLDAQLAAGRPAPASRLLAIRASQLVARPARERLARAWLDLLLRARTPATPFDPQVRIHTVAVAGTADLIVELVDGLRSPRPVTPQGVAMARLLLTSGTGPVYGRSGASSPALADAIGAALRHLPLA